jgi:hypothetical protein
MYMGAFHLFVSNMYHDGGIHIVHSRGDGLSSPSFWGRFNTSVIKPYG